MEAGKGWREEVVRKDDGRREKGVIGKRGGEGRESFMLRGRNERKHLD